MDNTLLYLQNSSYPTQPHSIIANYYTAYLSISYKDCSMYRTRRLKLCCKFQHITPVLFELHWLPIQYRIIFKILLLVYKSLNGTSPSYLAQKLHYCSHTRSLRSVSNELLMQPGSYTKTYGDRAFAVHAPRKWNLLPYEIWKSNTISSFKRSLKTYLFTNFSNNGSLFL